MGARRPRGCDDVALARHCVPRKRPVGREVEDDLVGVPAHLLVPDLVHVVLAAEDGEPLAQGEDADLRRDDGTADAHVPGDLEVEGDPQLGRRAGRECRRERHLEVRASRPLGGRDGAVDRDSAVLGVLAHRLRDHG